MIVKELEFIFNETMNPLLLIFLSFIALVAIFILVLYAISDKPSECHPRSKPKKEVKSKAGNNSSSSSFFK